MNRSIRKYFPIFLLPTLAAFTIGFLVPFILGVYLSFCQFTTITDAMWTGFSNYPKLFGDAVFRHSLWYYGAVHDCDYGADNVLAFLVALALTRKIRGRNLFRTVFFRRT